MLFPLVELIQPTCQEGLVTDFGGPLLAIKGMVHEHHDVDVRDAVVSFPMRGPPVPGRGADSDGQGPLNDHNLER